MNYDEARALLDEARDDAFSKYAAEARRRRIVAGVALVAWIAVSALLFALLGGDSLIVSEVGTVAVIAFGIFYLFPSFTAKGNLGDMFAYYADGLGAMQAKGAPLDGVADTEGLIAAIDAFAEEEKKASQSFPSIGIGCKRSRQCAGSYPFTLAP